MDGQWMAGSLQKPGEAGHRPTGVSGEPGPSLWPPGSQDVQGSAGPGCPADFSLLRMVFGLLPICWLFGLVSLGGVGRVTFISCLLAPVGASLAAL